MRALFCLYFRIYLANFTSTVLRWGSLRYTVTKNMFVVMYTKPVPLALCLSVVLKDDGVLTADGFLVAAFLYYSNGSSEMLPSLATD